MSFQKYDAERLVEIAKEIDALLCEFKSICKYGMSTEEFQGFKYRTLAHIEQGVTEQNDWMPDLGIDPLEVVAQRALDNCDDDDDDDDDDD